MSSKSIPFAALKSTRDFFHEGGFLEALRALDIANQQGSPSSSKLLTSLLQWCIDRKNIRLGRMLHCTILKRQLESNAVLASYIVRMFAACGNLQDANKVFSTLPNPNIFMWSAIILAHANLGQGAKAITLYQLMLQRQMLKPDAHTFVAVLKACSNLTDIEYGRQIHAHAIENGLELDSSVGNTLIDMYAK
eukprot:c25258_g14_i1 orf=561-1136(+)